MCPFVFKSCPQCAKRAAQFKGALPPELLNWARVCVCVCVLPPACCPQKSAVAKGCCCCWWWCGGCLRRRLAVAFETPGLAAASCCCCWLAAAVAKKGACFPPPLGPLQGGALNSTQLLWPPKPNELDKATLTLCCTFSFAHTSLVSTPTSGFSRLIVGCSQPFWLSLSLCFLGGGGVWLGF